MGEEPFDLAIVGGGVLGDRAAGRGGVGRRVQVRSPGGVPGFGRAMMPVEDVLRRYRCLRVGSGSIANASTSMSLGHVEGAPFIIGIARKP
jgi:hypothetical protein